MLILSSAKIRILALSREKKRALVFALDAIACVVSVAIAYLLRTDRLVWPVDAGLLPYTAALLYALPSFILFGLYRAIFRFAGWGAFLSIFKACAVYGALYAVTFALVGFDEIPRMIGLLQPVLLFLMIGATRAIARLWLGGRHQKLIRDENRARALIYGAGAAGHQLAGVLSDSREIEVVGFIDDDPDLQGSVLNGRRIHAPAELYDLVTSLNISDLLLAIPSASRNRRNEILEFMRGTSANIRTLPGLVELAQGTVTINDLRDLDIEDLLGRDAVPPDQALLGKSVTGKTVLVTGAGGSIGSELCRQIAVLGPTTLLLVEMNEYNLYAVHQDLERVRKRSFESPLRIIPLLGSVLDEDRMRAIIETWQPHTIYHAAAYKHVPLVEHNPAEGVHNNVFGTLNMARLAKSNEVSDFVLISTDKAVRPTSIMGASKRLAEQAIQALAATPGRTRFSIVRFGNVLGSSGSVVPLFRQQIKDRGPITITHQDITRYFMTIPEAAQLVIQAGAMAEGGEVFVLDMGEPVRIIDLARKMIELSGLTLCDTANPDGDIAIEIVGLRPGEKLYEELLIGDNPEQTGHPRILKARDSFLEWPKLTLVLEQLSSDIAAKDVQAVRNILKMTVPEFRPESSIVDWIYLENTVA